MVDLEELTRRVAKAAGNAHANASARDLQPMSGGASGLTYGVTLELGEDGVVPAVVKLAPPGLMPVKNRDVLRQAQIIKALKGEIPVPQVLFEDPGDPPEVSPFFVVNRVDGVCFEPILDPADALPAPSEVRARELNCARVLGRLHSVAPASVGLGDEPAVSLSSEVDRWEKVIMTIDEGLRPGAEEIAARLRELLPDPVAAVIQHGDFRLGNTLAENGKVNAVIDWEIWSIGDPRVDLGWYLMSTHSSKQPTALRDVDGMPADAELLAEYSSVAGPIQGSLAWFEALTQFKAASITGQIVKHNRRRDVPDPIVSTWDPHVPPTFLRNALRLLERAREEL